MRAALKYNRRRIENGAVIYGIQRRLIQLFFRKIWLLIWQMLC